MPQRPRLHEPASVVLTRTFRSPRSFHPSYSLLGRAIRYWTGDRLRGEALFLVTLTALVLVVLIAHYLSWALLQTLVEASTADEWQLTFWFGQLASVAAIAGVAVVGFRPPLTATCDDDAGVLHVDQGSDALALSYDAIASTSVISAQRFHRHYRRYARTRTFVGSIGDAVLLVDTRDGPVILAFDDADAHDALHTHLQDALTRVPESTPATSS